MIHKCSCIHIVDATVLMSYCYTVPAGSLPPDSCYYAQHLEDTVGSSAVSLILFCLQAFWAFTRDLNPFVCLWSRLEFCELTEDLGSGIALALTTICC